MTRGSLRSLGQLIDETARRFSAARLHYGHGTDNARDEAAFIVIRGLDLPFDASLSQAVDPQKVDALVRKRIRERIPAAYLLGETWLDGLPFYVDERVIVPRSHIAFLLGEGLAPWLAHPPRRLLDLCTGSGCLAVLAARAYPRARVTGSDISPAALAVARKNVARHLLQRRVQLRRSDLFEKLSGERFDLIVTNPPYVTTTSIRKLPPEYRHEPRIALAAGPDGLDLVRRIVSEARRFLAPKGLLVCEVGDGRRALERAYPRLPFTWAGEAVFLLERRHLPT